MCAGCLAEFGQPWDCAGEDYPDPLDDKNPTSPPTKD